LQFYIFYNPINRIKIYMVPQFVSELETAFCLKTISGVIRKVKPNTCHHLKYFANEV